MSVLIKEVQPLPDKESLDVVMAAVKKVLQQPGIVRLVVDARKDNLEYWRAVTEDEAAEKSISYHDMLRQVAMEEYDQHLEEGDSEKTPFEQLFEMFEMVEDSGCVPNFILSGADPIGIRKWLPVSRKGKSLFGIPLFFENTLEDDVLVICSSRVKEATAADIEYAVKVTLQ